MQLFIHGSRINPHQLRLLPLFTDTAESLLHVGVFTLQTRSLLFHQGEVLLLGVTDPAQKPCPL